MDSNDYNSRNEWTVFDEESDEKCFTFVEFTTKVDWTDASHWQSKKNNGKCLFHFT